MLKRIFFPFQLGSEDALSASGSDYTPYHNYNQTQQSSQQMITPDCRISNLEKEVAHWRSQYELTKLYIDSLHTNPEDLATISLKSKSYSGKLFNCSCTTTAAGITTIPLIENSKRYVFGFCNLI